MELGPRESEPVVESQGRRPARPTGYNRGETRFTDGAMGSPP